jgi:hypothetical protein
MLGDEVEVIVVDDASEDSTAEVVTEMQKQSAFRYVANHENVGMARNIVSAVADHARGEFVWVFSQHNLPLPNAIPKVLERIRSNPDVDAFQINFRCASFPAQWPSAAESGYSGEYDYLCNTETCDRRVRRWEDLLDTSTGLATQTYAHIVRRHIPIKFWDTQTIGRDFSNAVDTYTQTCGVAVGMFGKPAMYIGEPILTIYNGAQTWGSLEQRARVYLQGLPDLLRLYRSLGWDKHKLQNAEAWAAHRARNVIEELSKNRSDSGRKKIVRYASTYGSRPKVLISVARGWLRGRFPRLLTGAQGVMRSVREAHSYFFYRSRPARWVRRTTQ